MVVRLQGLIITHLVSRLRMIQNAGTLGVEDVVEQTQSCTAKTEICIPYLGYAPCNSSGMKFIPLELQGAYPRNFIPLELQGAYPRYGIHTSVFAVCRCESIIVGGQLPQLESQGRKWNNSGSHAVVGHTGPHAPAAWSIHPSNWEYVPCQLGAHAHQVGVHAL